MGFQLSRVQVGRAAVDSPDGDQVIIFRFDPRLLIALPDRSVVLAIDLAGAAELRELLRGSLELAEKKAPIEVDPGLSNDGGLFRVDPPGTVPPEGGN